MDISHLKDKYLGYKVAFVGCGKIAHFHADSLRYLGIKISAVCGTTRSKHANAFAAKYGVKNIYDDAVTLAYAEKPDAFWIVVSWNAVHRLLLPMLKIGTPCFFEKPVALSSAFLENVIGEIPSFIPNARVGYNRRFYDFVPKIKRYIEQLGLRAAEVHIPEQTQTMSSGMKESLLPYLWLYSSSHLLDLLLYLVGPLEVVTLVHGSDSDKTRNGYLASCHALLTAVRSNAPVHLSVEWDTPQNAGLTLYCGNLRIVVSPLEHMRIYKGLKITESSSAKPIRDFEPILIEEEYVDLSFKPGFLLQTADFLETMLVHPGSASCGCTLDQALSLTRLCEHLSGNK